MQVDAVARDFIANHGELDRLVGTFADDGDMDGSSFGSLKQIGYVASAHVIGGLAIDGDDDVSGANARTISGCASKWGNDDDFVVARADRHADAVVLAALIFAQQRVGLRIKEIRVRV